MILVNTDDVAFNVSNFGKYGLKITEVVYCAHPRVHYPVPQEACQEVKDTYKLVFYKIRANSVGQTIASTVVFDMITDLEIIGDETVDLSFIPGNFKFIIYDKI